jgi:hypothetical protein
MHTVGLVAIMGSSFLGKASAQQVNPADAVPARLISNVRLKNHAVVQSQVKS